MQNRFDPAYAQTIMHDPLAMRVYTSNLLGQESDLVLHGGGNTSVKIDGILHVKGSGWDLVSIKKEGFAPVKMDALLAMAEEKTLSDSDMVSRQKAAMTDANAPGPSVEAILHALIPFTFVDHTHADAVVTLSNTPNGEAILRELYGENMLIVPYVMPGFILARTIHEMTRDVDWQKLDGIILLNHGVFTFHDDPEVSYAKMIDIVSLAERYIETKTDGFVDAECRDGIDLHLLATLRGETARLRNKGIIARLNDNARPVALSLKENLDAVVHNGTLTPEHVIRIKPFPVIAEYDAAAAVKAFASEYEAYYAKHQKGETMLDVAPRWAVWPGYGIVSLGSSIKETMIISDITAHTADAMLTAEQLGGWVSLNAAELFEMEYWELEQAKLKKGGEAGALEGRIAVIADAAAGETDFLVETLSPLCGAVVILGGDPELPKRFGQSNVLPIICDVTDEDELAKAADSVVYTLGGVDLLISNVQSDLIDHDRVINAFGSYLELGFKPKAVVLDREDTELKPRTFEVVTLDNDREDISPEAFVALIR